MIGLLLSSIAACGCGTSGTGGDADAGTDVAADLDGSAEQEAGCSAMSMTAVGGSAFTGSDPCAGVPGNVVLYNSTESNAHNTAYCDGLAICSPGSGCGGAPGWGAGVMMVYVFGSATGCGATATIVEVRDCGAQIEIDYRIQGSGVCALNYNAWASVWVAARAAPAVFNLLP